MKLRDYETPEIWGIRAHLPKYFLSSLWEIYMWMGNFDFHDYLRKCINNSSQGVQHVVYSSNGYSSRFVTLFRTQNSFSQNLWKVDGKKVDDNLLRLGIKILSFNFRTKCILVTLLPYYIGLIIGGLGGTTYERGEFGDIDLNSVVICKR